MADIETAYPNDNEALLAGEEEEEYVPVGGTGDAEEGDAAAAESGSQQGDSASNPRRSPANSPGANNLNGSNEDSSSGFNGNKGANVQMLFANEMKLFERRRHPLVYQSEHFQPNTLQITKQRVYNTPMRMTDQMKDQRSKETLAYGQRRMKEVRKMEHEFPDKIKEAQERQAREEQERTGKSKERVRWWHRKSNPDERDPLKLLRFNNLTVNPEDLMSAKDVVILNLTGCKLKDEAMSWVGAFVQQSYTIKRLILQGNHITQEGCNELYMGLKGSKTLMDLDISLNPIGDEGLAVICNALVENTRNGKIYKLNVGTCDISSQGGFHLGRLIRESKVLTCLLAWRNRLGVGKGARQSGAAQVLEELRGTQRMRLVDLTANNISDKDGSDHAQMYEIEARKRRLQHIESARNERNLAQLRLEIEEKKETAVWDDEKVKIAKMEREAEQLKMKISLSAQYSQRRQTYEEKKQTEFNDRVEKATGLALNTDPPKVRLILTGNTSIMPQTLKRLGNFYDLSKTPDYGEFVDRPRRYDNIIKPRRQVGEEYPGLRDADEHDAHNVTPWDDKFDADDEYLRRQALVQWREEERIRQEEMRPVKFEKFAFKVPEKPTNPNAKAVMGIGVASGVNDNIRMAHKDKDDEPREMPKPVDPRKVGEGKVIVETVVREAEVDSKEASIEQPRVLPKPVDPTKVGAEVVVEEKPMDEFSDEDERSGSIIDFGKPTDLSQLGAVKQAETVPRQEPDAPKTTPPAEPSPQKEEATPPTAEQTPPVQRVDTPSSTSGESDAGDGFWKGNKEGGGEGDYEQLIPGAQRRGDSDEETDESGDDDDDDGVQAYADEELPEGEEGAQIWVEKEIDEQDWMQEKLAKRNEEIRQQLEVKATTARLSARHGSIDEGSDSITMSARVAQHLSASGGASNLPVPSPRIYASAGVVEVQPSTEVPQPAPLQSEGSGTQGSARVQNVVIPAMTMSMNEKDSGFSLMAEAMIEIAAKREEIIRLGEIGSPSDEDIKKREEEAKELGNVKQLLANQVRSLKHKVAVPEDHVEPLSNFFESLLVESDLLPGNSDLFEAMLSKVDLDFPNIIIERGLAANAAIDGSQQYLNLILSQDPPIVQEQDLAELIFACLFNQSVRIPLTKMIFDKQCDLALIMDDVMSNLQEFFEDIASVKRAIPKEDRRARMELLKMMIDHDLVGPQLQFEEEGPDAQTAFSRACYEGDGPLVDMLIATGRVAAPGMVKSDDTTPLMQAVFSNDPEVVQKIMAAFGPEALDINKAHPENGTAMDLAILLKRDPQIAAILKENGATSKMKGGGKAKAPAKSKVKVKVAVKKPTGKGSKAPAKPSSSSGSRSGSRRPSHR